MTRLGPVLGICVVLSVFICAVLINSCHSGSDDPQVLTAATQLRGDIDDDGQPSVADAIGILRVVVGLDGANEAADADGDGNTSVNDAIAVLRCVVGLAQWPLGEFTLPATRTIGPGVVVETDFTVGAEERVECLGDTTVQCDTATITGELYGSPGAAGADGADVTIEAQGDVVLTGALYAGDGGAGDASGTGGDGGNGGSVTVNSANGDITIGAEVETAAGAPDSFLGAGDGGDGADGTQGGHGGDGGEMRIACLNGTLTFNQQPGLLHVGNGGTGGDGVMTPAELRACAGDALQLHNGGGDGGPLTASFAAIVGITLEDAGTDGEGNEWRVGIFDEGVGDGGRGGDAGSFSCVATGETAAAGAGVSTATTAGELYTVQGDKGGDSSVGWAGNGESYTVDWQNESTEPGHEGDDLVCTGGDGGNCEYDTHFEGTWLHYTVGLFTDSPMHGGNGGNVTGKGHAGGVAAACSEGCAGGNVTAVGGKGGNVKIPTPWWDEDKISVGNGGKATATGGAGGPGGQCCSQTEGITLGPGHVGGKGGNATATGGPAGKCEQIGLLGEGGEGAATGGSGGTGGTGVPGASGGSPGTPKARGGKGDPRGKTTITAGSKGPGGATCPGSEVDPPQPDDITGKTDPHNQLMRATPLSPAGSAAPTQGDGFETTSDALGNYTFSGMAPGEYLIIPDGSVAGIPHYWLPSMREVTKVAGEALTGMHFTRVAGAQYTVTVRVMDEDREPVAGVAVTLVAYSNRPDCDGITGANGVATIAGVWSGLYTVVVTPPAGLVTFPDTQRVMVTNANAWTIPVMLVEEE